MPACGRLRSQDSPSDGWRSRLYAGSACRRWSASTGSSCMRLGYCRACLGPGSSHSRSSRDFRGSICVCRRMDFFPRIQLGNELSCERRATAGWASALRSAAFHSACGSPADCSWPTSRQHRVQTFGRYCCRGCRHTAWSSSKAYQKRFSCQAFRRGNYYCASVAFSPSSA